MLLKEAVKSAKLNEIPVSAVIVKDNKIIAKAHNMRVKTALTMAHAEIIVIKKANKRLKDWRLKGCDLYVTLKPCDMCSEVIKEARISNVYYLIDPLKFKKKYNKTTEIKLGDEYNDYFEKISAIFSGFFSDKR